MNHIFSILLFVFPLTLNAQSFHLEKEGMEPKPIYELGLGGNHYHGQFLKDKLHDLVMLAGLDSSEIYYELMDNLRDRNDSVRQDFYSVTYPEYHLFLDINEDGREDMIFQSQGPFIFDSPAFLVFLSKEDGTYRHYLSFGKLISVQKETIKFIEFRSAEGLRLVYKKYGCCAFSGWDSINCDFFFLNEKDHYNEDIPLWSVNLNTLE